MDPNPLANGVAPEQVEAWSRVVELLAELPSAEDDESFFVGAQTIVEEPLKNSASFSQLFRRKRDRRGWYYADRIDIHSMITPTG